MMHELVTGSHGFLGERLISKLKSAVRMEREDYRSTRLKVRPDRIFHLAAYGSHRQEHDCGEMFRANVLGLYNLLVATKDDAYKAFVVVGSSSEYGRKTAPMCEGDVLVPETFYAATKAAATEIAIGFAKTFDKPVVIVRPFSVYGPGEADHRLIPTICRSIIRGEPMVFDPIQKHDWIFVDDFIEGVVEVSENAKKLQGQVVNIGTGRQFENRDVLEILEMTADKKANITETKQFHTSDSPVWQADNEKLEKLGWKARTSLVGGLEKTFKFYENKYRT